MRATAAVVLVALAYASGAGAAEYAAGQALSDDDAALFLKLVRDGRFIEASQTIRRRRKDADKEYKRALTTTSWVAVTLYTAVQNGAKASKGKNVEYETVKGTRSGIVKSVLSHGVNVESPNTGVVTTRWKEMTLAQRCALAGTINAKTPYEHVAAALVAIWRGDAEAARDHLAQAEVHPLTPHIRKLVGPEQPGERKPVQREPLPRPPSKPQPVDVPPEASAALRESLEWLVDNQEADGSWAIRYWYGNSSPKCRVHVTGLATLALCASARCTGRGEYHDAIRAGAAYLMKRQSRDGMVGENTSGRCGGGLNHAVGGYALVEAAVVLDDRKIADAARRAVAFTTTRYAVTSRGHRNASGGDLRRLAGGWFVMQVFAANAAAMLSDEDTVRYTAAALKHSDTSHRNPEFMPSVAASGEYLFNATCYVGTRSLSLRGSERWRAWRAATLRAIPQINAVWGGLGEPARELDILVYGWAYVLALRSMTLQICVDTPPRGALPVEGG